MKKRIDSQRNARGRNSDSTVEERDAKQELNINIDDLTAMNGISQNITMRYSMEF